VIQNYLIKEGKKLKEIDLNCPATEVGMGEVYSMYGEARI
jgi:hypothetical protein